LSFPVHLGETLDLTPPTFKRKLNLLISSPNARVFYHFDVPGQTLIQLRGRKRIWLYPAAEPFLPVTSVENTVRSVSTEGLDYQDWFDEYAEVHDMQPGICCTGR
jgi:hypothetical protein